jgi:hypothetical protein
VFCITDKPGARRVAEGRKVEGVGVMKDKELKLEEIEASHTLGGAGEVSRGRGERRGCKSYSAVIHT